MKAVRAEITMCNFVPFKLKTAVPACVTQEEKCSGKGGV